jgi:hypothetical protein
MSFSPTLQRQHQRRGMSQPAAGKTPHLVIGNIGELVAACGLS